MNTEAAIKKIEQMVSEMHHAQNKKAWCSVRWVKQLTGWNAEELRMARDQGLIEFKLTGKGRFYNINSIPDRLLLAK